MWSNSNGYAAAIDNTVKIFDSNMNQVEEIELDYSVDELYGGELL